MHMLNQAYNCIQAKAGHFTKACVFDRVLTFLWYMHIAAYCVYTSIIVTYVVYR